MSLLSRRMMLNSMREKIILIKSDALEQGTINVTNGENLKSELRVRTKNFIDIEKGRYEITCEGAKQGNIIEYDTDETFKKYWFEVHTAFPWSANFTKNCKIRISLSNGTEEEKIPIIPSDVSYIKIRKII